MKIKTTDKVSLIAVTHHNHVWLGYMDASEASKWIRGWWDAREAARKGSPEEQEAAREWLSKGTVAVNLEVEGGGTIAAAAVAWEHVVGIYIELRNSAQDRIASAIEKQVTGDLPGEEWKKGGDDE